MAHPRGEDALARMARMAATMAAHREFLAVIEPVLTSLQCRRQPHIAMQVWSLLDAHVRGLEQEECLLEDVPCRQTRDHLHEHVLLRDYVANVNRALRTWRLEPDFVWVSACLLANWLRSHVRRLEEIIQAPAHSQPAAATPAPALVAA